MRLRRVVPRFVTFRHLMNWTSRSRILLRWDEIIPLLGLLHVDHVWHWHMVLMIVAAVSTHLLWIVWIILLNMIQMHAIVVILILFYLLALIFMIFIEISISTAILIIASALSIFSLTFLTVFHF